MVKARTLSVPKKMKKAKLPTVKAYKPVSGKFAISAKKMSKGKY
jgi:hypothetical protein